MACNEIQCLHEQFRAEVDVKSPPLRVTIRALEPRMCQTPHCAAAATDRVWIHNGREEWCVGRFCAAHANIKAADIVSMNRAYGRIVEGWPEVPGPGRLGGRPDGERK